MLQKAPRRPHLRIFAFPGDRKASNRFVSGGGKKRDLVNCLFVNLKDLLKSYRSKIQYQSYL